MSADKATALTPKKNEIFSRVRTTFVDCQVTASLVIRLETYPINVIYLGVNIVTLTASVPLL